MKVRILLAAAVLLTAALAVLSNMTGQSIPHLAVQGVLAPFRYAGNALTNQAENIYTYLFEYEALKAENEELRKKVTQMEELAREADAMARENDRLRDILDMSRTHEEYVLVDAYLIAWSSTDWSSTITINRGTRSGIQPGMVAITSDNEVVGVVTEAGADYAVVKTVLDSSLEISATIASSGYNGMVSGGYIEGRKDMLRMRYLPSSAVIRNNDQVVTSGSAVYPRNLILGSVVDAGYDDTGVAKYAVLEPAAEIGKLEQVFILTNFGVGAEAAAEAADPTEAAE